MFIYAIGVVLFIGMICIVKEIIYPYKPVIEYIRKNRPHNYDWVSGSEDGEVILDEEKN